MEGEKTVTRINGITIEEIERRGIPIHDNLRFILFIPLLFLFFSRFYTNFPLQFDVYQQNFNPNFDFSLIIFTLAIHNGE